jgi:hypothetical protein
MMQARILSFGLSAVFCMSLFTLACSSDSSSPSVDAGKQDSGSGSGGKGGSSGAGGSSGSGGSSAKGGSTGSGGSSAKGGSGGSAGSGGSTGSGGSAATGGSAGKGGSSGTGGSTGGNSGKVTDGGGSTDAEDAPLQGNDGSGGNEAGTIDGGSPVLLDSGSLDQGSLDVESIDTMVVHLDAEMDVERLDMEGIDVSTNPIPCSSVALLSMGSATDTSTPSFGTTGNYCFATCDDISGWNGSNLDGRSILLVNGHSVTIPTNGATGTVPLPTPKYLGVYNLFQINGGSRDYATIYWWGTGHTCEAPDGGFGL